MLANLPDETVQLLIDICTGQTHLSDADDASPMKREASPSPSYLSYLALGRSAAAEGATPASASPNTPIAKQIVEEHNPDPRRTASASDVPQPGTPTLPSILLTKPKPEKIPSPRQYFSHFVDNMEKFIVFLEAVALRRWGQSVDSSKTISPTESRSPPFDEEADKSDQIAVWDTLLELYLTLSKNESDDGPLRQKALALLQSSSLPYDPMHALMLCTTGDFTPGLVLLWERLGMYEEVLRFWIAQEKEAHVPGASAQVIAALNKYGANQPQLYPLVLRFLSSSSELQRRHATDLEAILEHVEREKIMPPLGVIQALSRNNVTSVGLMKKWLLTRIRGAREEIQTVSGFAFFCMRPVLKLEQDQQLITSYREETTAKLKQVEELSDPDHPKVFHVTRCATCNTQLELPSVHFMCNHSYHQRYALSAFSNALR